MSYELVWFKRDLRWEDHAALAQASRKGPVRCIYVIEPDLWLQPDSALQHFEFVRESLQALDKHLRTLGGCIEIFTGELTQVLHQIWQDAPFTNLHSHEETGNAFTYARDLKVASWCHSQAVTWHEYPQFGVVRGLKDRNVWQSAWERHMSDPISTAENLRFWQAPPQAAMIMRAPPHLKHNPPRRQRGGRPMAMATRTAKQRVHERRRDPEVKVGKKAVIEKHASRQGFRSTKKTAKAQTTDTQQMGFDF